MFISSIMNKRVKTISPNSTIKSIAERMAKYGIGSIIITSGKKLVGIVTERDIMTKVVAKNRDTVKTKAKDIMTKEVVMIDAEADIEDASKLMKKHKIKKLPVIQDNRLVGIVTMTDIIKSRPEFIKRLSELIGVREGKGVAG